MKFDKYLRKQFKTKREYESFLKEVKKLADWAEKMDEALTLYFLNAIVNNR